MVQYIDLVEDTICAQITAPGYAGVSVIRISGQQALKAAKSFCPFLPLSPESQRCYFGEIVDLQSSDTIDQCLVTCFAQGQSFTGDEVVEISCHGNPMICQTIISFCLEQGCRSAEPGEFSFRAFYNGKIDLVQAESINQLVMSQTQLASQATIDQLQGGLSDVYNEIEFDLLEQLSHLEASIDFVEQDIEPGSTKELLGLYDSLNKRVSDLVESYDVGKNLMAEREILLLGETNVGKSSLFNCFLNKDKAIVTDIAGTTRDLLEDRSYLGNFSVRFIDSAGLRSNPEKIEQMGITKTLGQLKNSEIVLWVLDATAKIEASFLPNLEGKKVFVVFNKVDLIDEQNWPGLRKELDSQTKNFSIAGVHFVSAKNKMGLAELTGALRQSLEKSNHGDYPSIVTQARHYNHLVNIKTFLLQALELAQKDDSPDLISHETQMALTELHKIMGKTYDDEILDRIFSSFCIGK